MKRRLIALGLIFLLVFSMLGTMGVSNQKVEAAGVTLIVHYNRSAGDYDGWNLWVWPDGGEGKECNFTAEDDFGKIAVFKSDVDTDKVGFLVKFNEWEEKDISEDRFVTLKDGFAEIWINSGEEEILTEAPAGAKAYDVKSVENEKDKSESGDSQKEGELEVNIHYHRYGEDYDGWNIWAWEEGKEGAAYELNGEDEFGKVATFSIADYEEASKLGFIIRLNEWESKDYDGDRFVEFSQAKNGVLDIYLVQASSEVYLDQSKIDLSAKFLSAAMQTSKEIVFNVTVPIDTSDEKEVDNFTVTDTEGKEYPIMKVWSKEPGKVSSASLIMEEKLDLSKSYIIARKDYGKLNISMGEAFSTKEFEEAFYYEGNDLGAIYTKEKTNFRVWAPTASKVQLNLYEQGLGDNLIKSVDMTKDMKGTWIAEEIGDLQGVYYTYSVTVDGNTNEAVDLYARTTGANGERGMILDLSSTNPDNWDSTTKPEFVNATDAVIYELHVRDLSSDSSSGIKNVGKYLAFTEKGTKNSAGLPTGIDHLIDLGITHVHLLPSFDYATVDETKLEEDQFNWGYDPENYNVPEGSYATDPYNGEVRVNEYKQMVQALHESGIRVVMDVVYNHTSTTLDSNFNKIVPDYYYRKDGDSFSNASGCGNETASERAMVRKYIVDSVVYWATEYKIDGFRFDLMGIHDIETMNAVSEALHEIDSSILIYGEGWTASTSTLSENLRALKATTYKLDDIAAFSDDIRDGIKGSVFDSEDKGFATGKEAMEETIKFGIVAATENEQIDYSLVNYSENYWAGSPSQCINYVSAHDNLTLWDKIASSNPEDSVEDRIKMNKLSSAIVLTSQGIPFFQAGEEFLRSKPNGEGGFDENSYKSSDAVNSLKWDTKTENIEVYNYYKGLIAFRKAHPALRMTTTKEVQDNLIFMEGLEDNVVAYTIENQPNGEEASKICVIHNANKEPITVDLTEGAWKVYINGESAGTEVIETITDQKAQVEGISTMVLIQDSEEISTEQVSTGEEQKGEEKKMNNISYFVIILVFVIIFIISSVVGYRLYKKVRVISSGNVESDNNKDKNLEDSKDN